MCACVKAGKVENMDTGRQTDLLQCSPVEMSGAPERGGSDPCPQSWKWKDRRAGIGVRMTMRARGKDIKEGNDDDDV